MSQVVAFAFWGLVAVIGTLALLTRLYVRHVERRHPPQGEMIDVGGYRLHVMTLGAPTAAENGAAARAPLVFVHGASGNLSDQLSAFASLCEPDRLNIFVDRPGHGHSERGPSENDTASGQARTLAGLLDRLSVERAVLVGHSYGGAVAAAFAVLHPERTAGLVLLSPATHPWPGGKTSWYYEFAARPLIGWLFAQTLLVPLGLRRMSCALSGVFSPQPVPPGFLERSASALAIRPGQFLANASDVTCLHDDLYRLSFGYPQIEVPTVIITGDEDAIVHGPWHAEPMSLQVWGSRLLVVPGLGHKPDHVLPDLVMDAVSAVDEGRQLLFDPPLPELERVAPAPAPNEAGLETTPESVAALRSAKAVARNEPAAALPVEGLGDTASGQGW